MSRLFLIIFLLSSLVFASSCTGSKAQKKTLNQKYTIGKFQIIYTLQGEHAILQKNRIDLDNNNIPDYVENIGFKFQATYELLTDVFGFQDPLLSPRYGNQTDFFRVTIIHTSKKGISYDEMSKKRKSLNLKVSNDLSPNSMTPTHELFHIFQNGYSMFKNRWYTEGTSRWSEYILKKGTGRTTVLPDTAGQIEELVKQTYKAGSFWNRLAFLCDDNDGTFIFDLNKYKAVGSDYTIIEDNKLFGYSFMRSFLQNLDIEDGRFSKGLGDKEYEWEESAQKSEKNNLPILCALKHSVVHNCTLNSEINIFLLALDTFTRQECTDFSPVQH